ncbi:MAG: VIT1/CCC1 transporter family protein [Terriglobales bacterium]
MPTTEHVERHFTGRQRVRDIVIGMSDGLTVPFALAAGLSGAVANTRIIVIAGLAEIAAGSIAMGLGGYLAAKSDLEHYEHELAREWREVKEIPEAEQAEVAQVLESYGLTAEEAAPVVTALRGRPRDWVDFMMRFELGLERPDPRRAIISGSTIALSYIAGGMIPLAPYALFTRPHFGLAPARFDFFVSVVVTLIALAVFGFIKGRFTGHRPGHSALQTVLIGGVAAAAAYLLAGAIS